MPKRLSVLVVLIAVLVALGLRVLPPYHAVFTAQGVSFEEADAWFHVRMIHNLLAHFPKWSAYDPYAIFPGGENIVTRPFWDYLVGSIAWITGAGSPSGNLTDEIAAWLPAILGALLPIPVFFTARRLFGVATASMSAFWVAMIPGRFLWVGHLGMADHHAAEVFAALLNLALLCAAVQREDRMRWLLAGLAGLALAAFFETQVTGIYLPAILAVATVISPSLAGVNAVAIATCCILLLPADALSPWREYRWLSLIAALAVTASLAILHEIARRRRWTRVALYRAVGGVSLIVIAGVGLLDTKEIQSLLRLVTSYQSGALSDQVGELQPLWTAGGGGFINLFGQFGMAWLFALPGIAMCARMLWRGSSPALILFSVWSALMIYGVFLHIRMGIYAGLSCSIFAGISSAWLVTRVPADLVWLRGVASALFFAAALAVSLPIIYLQTHEGHGPDTDWREALDWLRWNTPDPMGDAGAWYGLWPRLEPGAASVYPKSAYGILTVWDKGWWINGIAHRIPSANGGESGAVDTSRFLSETHPEDALREMQAIGARYALVSPAVLLQTRGLAQAAGRSDDEYLRFVSVPDPEGKTHRAILYRPAFYRSMAARLELFNGHSVDTRLRGVDVYVTTTGRSPGKPFDESISAVHHFASEADAESWLMRHPEEDATLGSTNPDQSCVDLEEVPWIRPAFVSKGDGPFSARHPGAVKIFERTQ